MGGEQKDPPTSFLPLKKSGFFWSNPYKVEVMITSLTEMLELPNFAHMAKFTLLFESRDAVSLVTSWTS